MKHSSVVALVAAMIALAGAAGATAPSAEFDESQYETTQAGTVTLTVSVNDTDTAGLQVGSESAGYTLNATLVDENGDGTVAVEFSVPNAGTDDQTLTAVGGDAIENAAESEFHEPPLAPGAYRLAVSGQGEEVTDVSRLTIEEASGSTTATPTTSSETAASPETTVKTTGSPETTTAAPATEDSSNGDSPGFGVGVALAGVLGAALLAARR